MGPCASHIALLVPLEPRPRVLKGIVYVLVAGGVRDNEVDSLLLKRPIPEAPINAGTPARPRPSLVGPNDAPRPAPVMLKVRLSPRLVPDIVVGL